MITTTLNAIREHDPCADGWKKLLKTLGKTQADAEPISLGAILESNGLDDAIWCLRTIEGYDKEIWHFAIECARDVQYLMQDGRSVNALDVSERYINGTATQSELNTAKYAARSAAYAAYTADAARSAAYAAYATCTTYTADAAKYAAYSARFAAAAAADANIREKQRIRFIEMFG